MTEKYHDTAMDITRALPEPWRSQALSTLDQQDWFTAWSTVMDSLEQYWADNPIE